MSHIVINSNKWFSAVSDYSVQLACYLNKSDGPVTFYTQPSSPLPKKLQARAIPWSSLSLLPAGPIRLIKAWRELSRILTSNASSVVWTFEGREHTLCALHRRLHKKLWRGRRLIRVRGQAAPLRSGRLNSWLYLKATDKIVFAAAAVARLSPFYFGARQARVQLYCADTGSERKKFSEAALRVSGAPDLDFSKPMFLVVGRFDPIKGHADLIEAFAKVVTQRKVQLVFVGESKNIRASELALQARKFLPQSLSENGCYFSQSLDNLKRLYIFDKHIEGITELMARAHFGVIPSLGSEVICRVAVEFLQAGVPLLASAVGALPETLAGTPSRLFAPGNIEEQSQALSWAMELFDEPQTMRRFREQCQSVGQANFALQRFGDLVAWATREG